MNSKCEECCLIAISAMWSGSKRPFQCPSSSKSRAELAKSLSCCSWKASSTSSFNASFADSSNVRGVEKMWPPLNVRWDVKNLDLMSRSKQSVSHFRSLCFLTYPQAGLRYLRYQVLHYYIVTVLVNSKLGIHVVNVMSMDLVGQWEPLQLVQSRLMEGILDYALRLNESCTGLRSSYDLVGGNVYGYVTSILTGDGCCCFATSYIIQKDTKLNYTNIYYL